MLQLVLFAVCVMAVVGVGPNYTLSSYATFQQPAAVAIDNDGSYLITNMESFPRPFPFLLFFPLSLDRRFVEHFGRLYRGLPFHRVMCRPLVNFPLPHVVRHCLVP